MMEGKVTWNYRVVKRADIEGEETYGIHEVYYNDDGSIQGITAQPVGISSESEQGLKEVIGMMQEAFAKKVLAIGDLNAANEMRMPNQW